MMHTGYKKLPYLKIVLLGLALGMWGADVLAADVAAPPAVQNVLTEISPASAPVPAKEMAAASAPATTQEVAPGAVAETKKEEAKDSKQAPNESDILEVIDAPRDYVSDKIVAITKRIDQFFGDERYYQETNKSVIQLDFNETIGQGGSRTFGFEGKAKLDLPAAEKRFHFVIESNPEKKTAGEVKKEQPATTKTEATPPPEQYAASLRYEKSEESPWYYSTDAGVKFQFPPDPFIRGRLSYGIPVGSWRMKISETPFWFRTIGLGETTQLDWEYIISKPLLFRATSTATCYEYPQNCDLRQDFSVYQTLTERSAMLYQASVIGVTEPEAEETAYVLLARYRYRLHRDWMYFEVTPQLYFPKADGFKHNASLLFKLEMLFGGKQ